MDLRVVNYLVLMYIGIAAAIRCKCTKQSETVKCVNDYCDVDGGSCLMLDHPSMGIHYTCHTKNFKEGDCKVKTSKSGASVRICGCDSGDFCNSIKWPNEIKSELLQTSETPANSVSRFGRHSALSLPFLTVFLALLHCVFVL